MFDLERLDALFVSWACLFQVFLIIHFALAIRYGRIVHALSVPAVMVSITLLLGGKTWSLALIRRPPWYVHAILIIFSSILNLIPHRKSGKEIKIYGGQQQ